jgi:hypothetical protein
LGESPIKAYPDQQQDRRRADEARAMYGAMYEIAFPLLVVAGLACLLMVAAAVAVLVISLTRKHPTRDDDVLP